MKSRGPWILLLALSVLLIEARPAHAYIDPGTGSYIFQVLIAGFVGAAFAVRVFWRRIRAFFGRLRGRAGSLEAEELPEKDA